MGELYLKKEKKRRCCLNCHYLSVYDRYPDQRTVLHRTWYETERTKLEVLVGDGFCAKGEWSPTDIWNLLKGQKELLTTDRYDCPSFEKFNSENRYLDIERFLQAKKGKTDRNRFVILAVIGLAGLFISWIGLFR